jgi:carboxyl-terminal processing protease
MVLRALTQTVLVNAKPARGVASIVGGAFRAALLHAWEASMRVPRWIKPLGLALPVLLAACGGGGDDDDNFAGACSAVAASGSTADRQDWLRCFFNDTYLWYALSPSPSPVGYSTVEAYFDDLLYRNRDPIPGGGGARWPVDTYSGFQSTESFNRFFGAGQTLGYGVAVNGIEAVNQGATRLFVRYVEPLSPAAQSSALPGGLQRGDEIVAVNNTPVGTLIAADDFSALSPAAAGNQLRLDVRRGGGAAVAVTLTAAVFTLTPVQSGQVVFSQGGRSLGYVFIKDMISEVQTRSPTLGSVMSSFRTQGVQDLVLDLRYNGGGLVDMGRVVASFVGGSAQSGQVFARLLYNDKQSASNRTFTFSDPGNWTGFSRVYVLTGERTCSASEQVINGLRGVGVNVVAIGDVTCGKPVGFLPADDGWGTTYSIVNFEGVNARSEGRYFDGLLPTCSVAEDFSQPIGDTGAGDNIGDPLLVAAAFHADGGGCPTALSRELPQSRALSQRKRYTGADGGERTGMRAR